MFLESPRFITSVNFATSSEARYEVFVTKLYGGHVVSDLINDEPLMFFDVGHGIRTEVDLQVLYKFYHQIQGEFHHFRYKDWVDFKSCDREQTPAPTDQALGTGDGITVAFQLIKIYGNTVRRIQKPVVTTVRPAIAGLEQLSRFSLTSGLTAQQILDGHTTLGVVTFSANVQRSISAITNAAAALVTTGSAHGLSVNDSVHFSTVSGMTQINGLRGRILTTPSSVSFTVAIDTQAFGAYSSGGVINTIPQTGESVTAGFEFDVPVRFASKLPTSFVVWKAGAQDCLLEEVRVT